MKQYHTSKRVEYQHICDHTTTGQQFPPRRLRQYQLKSKASSQHFYCASADIICTARSLAIPFCVKYDPFDKPKDTLRQFKCFAATTCRRQVLFPKQVFPKTSNDWESTAIPGYSCCFVTIRHSAVPSICLKNK